MKDGFNIIYLLNLSDVSIIFIEAMLCGLVKEYGYEYIRERVDFKTYSLKLDEKIKDVLEIV